MTLKLNDIPLLANSLKFGTTQSIKNLNTLLGFPDFDRSSRKKIRDFSAFPEDFDLEDHKTSVLTKLNLNEFISIATLLHLDPAGEKQELCTKIFLALSNLNEYQKSLDTSFLDDDCLPLSETPSQVANTVASAAETSRNQLESVSVSPPLIQTSILMQTPARSEVNNDNFLQQVNISESNSDSYNRLNKNSSIDDLNSPFWQLLKDLQSTCRYFNGDNLYSVQNFFYDIESTFNLFPSLSDQQKLVFAKTLIVGSAKTFLFSQRNLNSYDVFKAALLQEFSDQISSIEIHRLLSKRKKRNNETFQQYSLAMRELANRSESVIDESSVIQYIINGIPGDDSNKIILYGAHSFSEFKNKLKTYETVINNLRSDFRHTSNETRRGAQHYNQYRRPDVKQNVSSPNTSAQRCFNCNDFGHVSKLCPHRSRGPRCLNCNFFGHKSDQCRRTAHNDSSNPPASVNTVHEIISTNMCKDVLISNITFSGLVDTGSHLTLLRRSAWFKIGAPPLTNTTTLISGFGSSQISPFGSFHSNICIDNNIFQANILVVPNYCSKFDLIIGCDVINQATLTITPDGIFFSPIVQPSVTTEHENFIMTICADPPTFDIGPNASRQTRYDVEKLLSDYQPNKTKAANVTLDITLTDDKPIFHTPRRLPFAERSIVDEQIDEWIKNGIVEPCSSPYASQVVVVRKKNGKPRVCIDFRQLNRKLVKDHYPLPLIDDILDRLQNAKIFTTLDLRNGFFHVPVSEKSRPYTSFVTSSGQFQFRYMPFGLSSCPAVFMRYINAVFRNLIAQGIVLIYMDDFIIPASNEAEALKNLKIVLAVARDYGLEINFQKCKFLHDKIEFLGHVVENGKLFPSPAKTKAVLNYPDLKNTKDVRRFLGLTGYFRKFIPSYSTIAKPLTDLLRKDSPFQFQAEQKDAFNKLKHLLSHQPVLNLFNQNSPIEIHTDASIDGLGAVLLQKSIHDNKFHPVFYSSKKTSDSERKYNSFELEVLAVVEALKKFRVYVLGTQFKLVTDCDAFVKTLRKKELNSRIARWALYLQDFDYTIEHRSGTKMAHVDALSRHPCCMLIQGSVHKQFITAQQTDDNITTIKTLLRTTPHDNYTIKNDILYKTVNGIDLLVVPEGMQTDIIKSAHERGHFALLRTQQHLDKEFFIPNLKDKIESVIKNCVICILNNRKRGKQDGMLHPIDKDDTPLHTFHIDHLGPLATTSKKYKHILSVIDAFTKFVWLYPTKSTDAAEVINRLENQSLVFGNPVRIISDKGPAFTSTAFKEYCQKQEINHVPITTGLPRSNGQVERLNSVIISVLSKLSTDNPDKWYSHVPAVQQTINSTFHRSINSTPFEILFGTKMKSENNTKIIDLLNEEIKLSFLKQRDDLRNAAKAQINKVQQENRKTYNLRRKQAQKFKLDDLVAIKRTQFGSGLKLKNKFLGPYKVIKVKINDTYDVEKCDFFDGPSKTSTCAEYMKPWSTTINDIT